MESRKILSTRESKKNFIIFICSIMVLFAVSQEVPKHFGFSASSSVGFRLFYYQKIDPAKIQKGDYVVFSVVTDLIPRCNPCQLLKKVGCVDGEIIECTQAGAYYCVTPNEKQFLGMAKSQSLEGSPMERFDYNGPVPAETIFATCGHKDGYDSRYFGFISKEKVIGKAIPLL